MLGQQPRVIRAGCLIDGSGQPALRNAAVVIEDGVITFVGPEDAPEVPAVPVEQQLDARDGTVLPGIIDTHVHLAFNTRKAAAVPEIIEQTQTDDLTLLGGRVIQAAQAALSGGTTTLRDCGAPGFVTLRIRDLIASRFISGPRLLASGMPITTTGGHLWWCGLEADSRDDVIRATRMLIREGVDFIKIMATGGGMTVGTNTAQPQYDAEQLAAIVREARRLGTPSEAGRSGRLTTAHSHCAAGHLNCMAAGVDMIEHCSWNTPEGGTRFEPEVAKQFVDHGTYISITLGNTPRDVTTPLAGVRPPGLASASSVRSCGRSTTWEYGSSSIATPARRSSRWKSSPARLPWSPPMPACPRRWPSTPSPAAPPPPSVWTV